MRNSKINQPAATASAITAAIGMAGRRPLHWLAAVRTRVAVLGLVLAATGVAAAVPSLSGVALAAPSAAPAGARTSYSPTVTTDAPAGTWELLADGAQSSPDYYWLHAHAHNVPLSTTSTSAQAWFFTNEQSQAGGPPGADGDAFEVELYGTSSPECINWVGNTALFYLESCVPGDANELFWINPTGGIDPAGARDLWFISVSATQQGAAGDGNYAFMTETGLGGPDDVTVESAGWGSAAAWGQEVNS